MSEDEFTKLFKYMQAEFKTVNDRLDETNVRIDTLTNSVDALIKQVETYYQEMLAIAHKVDRLERWIHEIAEATGVKLTSS